jgi:hypothetical protein
MPEGQAFRRFRVDAILPVGGVGGGAAGLARVA